MEVKDIINAAVEQCEPKTRYRLAKRLKVSPSAVYTWEAGRKHPSGKHLLEMLRIAQDATKKAAGGMAAVILGIALWGGNAGEAKATVQETQEYDRSTHYTKWRLLNSLAHLLRTWTRGPFTALAL